MGSDDRKPPLARRILNWLFRKPQDTPPDPYAYVGAPRKRGPLDRSSSVALDEPE